MIGCQRGEDAGKNTKRHVTGGFFSSLPNHWRTRIIEEIIAFPSDGINSELFALIEVAFDKPAVNEQTAMQNPVSVVNIVKEGG